MNPERSARTVDVLEEGAHETAQHPRVGGVRPARTNHIQQAGPQLLRDTAPADSSTPSRPSSVPDPEGIVNRSHLFQTIAFVFCVLFGLALIANTEAANDGVWFWYSVFFNNGKRLYADMHLPLQPLYVLETSAFMAVLGKGWLVTRIPAVLHLVAYCLGLLLLVRKSNLSDARGAILLACSFFVSINYGAFVFGDYHVLTDCFVVYSLIALLALRTSAGAGRVLGLAAILGVLCGLAVTTRVNDGAALVAGVVLAIVCLVPLKKVLSLVAFCLATVCTVVFIVYLTGDSLRDYAMNTVIKAAGIKGGGGTSILLQPLLLPLNTGGWLIHCVPIQMCFYALVGVLILTSAFLPLRRKLGWWQVGLAVLGITLVGFLADRTGLFWENRLTAAVAGVVVLLAYGLGLVVAVRFILWLLGSKRAQQWDRREVLLLIPLGQMASGAMSTGGTHYSLVLEPVGLFILLVAIYPPARIKAVSWSRVKAPFREALKASASRVNIPSSRVQALWLHFKAPAAGAILVGFAILTILCTVDNRFSAPYRWHTYREKPMFEDRTWYRHPTYGPMIISRDLLRMIQQVCRQVRDSGPDSELLSLPLPGGNYFCSVPPWHGYVQTFFDTTSKETIQRLMGELQQSPPEWILYQRQLTTLRLHEMTYNNGSPLAQRHLDELIEEKIGEGAWRVTYTSGREIINQWGAPWDNEWILIKTR